MPLPTQEDATAAAIGEAALVDENHLLRVDQ